MPDKTNDEVLIDCLVDTLAALEEQENYMRNLRLRLEPVLNNLYDVWQANAPKLRKASDDFGNIHNREPGIRNANGGRKA